MKETLSIKSSKEHKIYGIIKELKNLIGIIRYPIIFGTPFSAFFKQ